MQTKKQKGILCVILILGAGLFFLIKWQGPAFIKSIDDQGKTELLSAITGCQREKSLDDYVITAEERLLGPLAMVASGFAFLAFTFLFLKDKPARYFGLSVFGYLLLTRTEILTLPPYGDAVTGPFVEAIWLFRNSFDYIGLSKEPAALLGGPKIYFLTIFPGYQALLMKLIGPGKDFLIVNHLLVFAFGATVVTFFKKTLRKLFNEEIALLASILFLAIPLFQNQVEAINMEMPALLFGMICIYFLADKNIRMAALFAVLAFMVKSYAIFFCFTVFVMSMMLVLIEDERRKKVQAAIWGVAPLVFTLGVSLLSTRLETYGMVDQGERTLVGLCQGCWWMVKFFVITYLYLASLGIFVIILIREKLKQKSERLSSFIGRYFAPITFFVAVTAWFFVFTFSYNILYRYVLVLLPFALFCGFFVVQYFIRPKKALPWVLVGFIGFSFMCSYGLMCKPYDASQPSMLECSLNYRPMVRLYMSLAKEIEQKYQNFTIVAPYVIAQNLAFPELGYVRKGLDVVIYGVECNYGNIRNYAGYQSLNLRKTIWTGLDDSSFPLDPQDRVLKEISAGEHKAYIFLGGITIEKRYLALQRHRQLFDAKDEIIENLKRKQGALP